MGNPTVADAFGAKVSVSVSDRGLFLVIGRSGSPAALVSALGGRAVYQMPNDLAVLAAMPVAAFMALRRHRDIAHVGPVTIQPERFSQFMEQVRLNSQVATSGTTPT